MRERIQILLMAILLSSSLMIGIASAQTQIGSPNSLLQPPLQAAQARPPLQLNPPTDPASVNNPHKWLDYLGCSAEIVMLVYAGIMVVGCFDLLVLKKWLPAGILFFVAIVIAVAGIAAPGLCILVDQQVAHDDVARFSYVQGIKIALSVFPFVVCAIPPIVAIWRKQPTIFKCFVFAGSIAGVFVSMIGWLVAVHFAFADQKKRVQPETNEDAN